MGGGSKKKNCLKNMEKKISSRPFLAHPAGGQETTFYLRMALDEGDHCNMVISKTGLYGTMGFSCKFIAHMINIFGLLSRIAIADICLDSYKIVLTTCKLPNSNMQSQ